MWPERVTGVLASGRGPGSRRADIPDMLERRTGKLHIMTSGSSSTHAGIERMRYEFARLQTAPQFTAVLDCLFDLAPRRTEPWFEELVLVDDRLIFARARGEKTFRHFVGRRDQLAMNLLGFVKHLGLGRIEREYVINRIESIGRRSS